MEGVGTTDADTFVLLDAWRQSQRDKAMLKHKVVSILLSVLFIFSAHYFFRAYDTYMADRHAVQILKAQRERLENRREEQAEKRRILRRVGDFVGRAEGLGLMPSDWSRYDVNIEEALSFEETVNILAETAGTPSYYFKPNTLHIKTTLGPQGEADSEAVSVASMEGQQLDGKDVWLTLKGAFVVKNQQ